VSAKVDARFNVRWTKRVEALNGEICESAGVATE